MASFHHLAVLARIDAWFGIMAALALAAGVLRVFFGAEGVDDYFSNIFFWAKMALFAESRSSSRADHPLHRLAPEKAR